MVPVYNGVYKYKCDVLYQIHQIAHDIPMNALVLVDCLPLSTPLVAIYNVACI